MPINQHRVEISMNSKDRICFFAPNLKGGGAERVISILAAYFAENSYKVDLVLIEAVGPYLANIPTSVNVIDLNCKKALLSLPKLVMYLRTYQPSIVFSSQMHSSTVAIWAAKLAGMKTRVFIRQPTMLKPYYKKNSFTSILRQKTFLKTAKFAEKIIVTSDAMSKEFQALSKIQKDKIEVIYNPVSIEAIKQKSLEPIEHPWFQQGELPVILAVGRLINAKDFKTLIKAFEITLREKQARLMILGEGLLRLEIEQLIKDLKIEEYVQMPGFVSNPYQYMKYSKVFVLSSLWEGFPNSMVEAMACSNAIVATDCDGGASEILEYGKWGKLVPIQNEVRMAEAIIETLNMEKLPNVIERVEDFSVQHVFKKYNKLFNL